ncbi:hypothetical protein B0H10DRAFT_2221740 [Mycena sp. CBHHK59/15]|nr:hypothetical protein B0H10DRAFT_2221740 [Mycena sp. CBHHK59/15]
MLLNVPSFSYAVPPLAPTLAPIPDTADAALATVMQSTSSTTVDKNTVASTLAPSSSFVDKEYDPDLKAFFAGVDQVPLLAPVPPVKVDKGKGKGSCTSFLSDRTYVSGGTVPHRTMKNWSVDDQKGTRRDLDILANAQAVLSDKLTCITMEAADGLEGLRAQVIGLTADLPGDGGTTMQLVLSSNRLTDNFSGMAKAIDSIDSCIGTLKNICPSAATTARITALDATVNSLASTVKALYLSYPIPFPVLLKRAENGAITLVEESELRQLVNTVSKVVVFRNTCILRATCYGGGLPLVLWFQFSKIHF